MIAAIKITVLLFILSAHGKDDDDKRQNFNICQEFGVITNVTHIDETAPSTYFSLKINNNISINSKALSKLNITRIDINLRTDGLYDRSPNCSLSLQPDSFDDLSSLISLSIKNANLNFTGNPLAPLKSLTMLKLKSCGINDVPTEILSSLSNLLELSLADNYIQVIHSNAFLSMKNLQNLDLNRNNIGSLEPGCFNGLSELEILNLSINSIKAVPGIFQGLNHLKKLILVSSFGVNEFQPIILQDVPALIELQLDWNKLMSLSSTMFDNVPRLHTLSLTANSLRTIPHALFEKLKSLRELYLQQNMIETIEPRAFNGLNLTTLDLSLNDIQQISAESFNGLTINTLILHKNQIEELQSQAFNGLTANEMDLSQNSLQKIGVEDFRGVKCRQLDLTMNRIEEIASGAFDNIQVEKLILKMNPIITEDRATWGIPTSVQIEV
ncbi:insulin-like growth factor-binding protein complex acid labile subunit [Fopius arisanus]|uniref:IGFALS_1 protein n=1 Tax=Fopius arisanus TaxID=64838 RepID=A0A0C9Q5D6_9HYME|nr:PREDICTED: insulin-like growth factor-binding protein complex acid labile subunit [Fopius arisanus]